MSKVRWSGKKSFALVFFHIERGAFVYDSQRMVRPDNGGKASLRGVVRIGAKPAGDAMRVAFYAPLFPATQEWIAGVLNGLNRIASDSPFERNLTEARAAHTPPVIQ
jgi:hypothetical protein